LFGFSKKERMTKLAKKVSGELSRFISAPVAFNEGKVPESIRLSNYILGYFAKITANFHYLDVNGKTDQFEQASMIIQAVSIALQSEPKEIQHRIYEAMSNKDSDYFLGFEDAGKFIDCMVAGEKAENIEAAMKPFVKKLRVIIDNAVVHSLRRQ